MVLLYKVQLTLSRLNAEGCLMDMLMKRSGSEKRSSAEGAYGSKLTGMRLNLGKA